MYSNRSGIGYNFFRRSDLGPDPGMISIRIRNPVFDVSDDCYSIHLFRKIHSVASNFHMFSSIQHVIRHIHQLYPYCMSQN